VRDALTAEPANGLGGTWHRPVTDIDDTIEIEQHTAHASIMMRHRVPGAGRQYRTQRSSSLPLHV